MKLIPNKLGGDILQYSGDDETIIDTLSASRFNFLDELWLPVPLAELSADQVVIINRFREARVASDLQFKKAGNARKAFLGVLSSLGTRSLLEIGCGKFPLQPVEGCARYMAIEIDEEAAEWCRSLGFDVRHLSTVIAGQSSKFDTLVAAYVFHFHISDDLISCLIDIVTDDAVLIFNLIADSADNVLRLLSKMLHHWPLARIIKSEAMPRREYWVVLSGSDGSQRAAAASKSLREFWIIDEVTSNV